MIAIIDYGIGNLGSVANACRYLGHPAIVTSSPEEILSAEKVILPGVGAFRIGMENLARRDLVTVVKEVVRKQIPLLGICLGMQMLFEDSAEHGFVQGLGILPGHIVPFGAVTDEEGTPLKVPQIGWNDLEIVRPGLLFSSFKAGERPFMYFVHSYYLETSAPIVTSYTTYGKRIAVSIESGAVYGCQFHPEKSGTDGLSLLSAFLS